MGKQARIISRQADLRVKGQLAASPFTHTAGGQSRRRFSRVLAVRQSSRGCCRGCPDRDGDEQQEGVGARPLHTMRERMQQSNAAGFAVRPYRVGKSSSPVQDMDGSMGHGLATNRPEWCDGGGWPAGLSGASCRSQTHPPRAACSLLAWRPFIDSCMVVGGWMVDGQKHRAGMGDDGGVDASRLVYAFASRRER